MPYLDDNGKECVAAGKLAGSAGELTYMLQQAITEHMLWFDRPLRYEDYAAILGALEGAKADFIDRILLPYEKKKRKENGDVWPKKLIPKSK
jgi:hypothetical protein